MTTNRQKIAAKKILEKTGTSVSKAMLEAGYSPATAKNPQQLTRSKAWKELLEEYLPNDKLMKKHNALLNKKEYIAIGKAGEREVVGTGEIDANAVSKGLDMAYKLKGQYSAEKVSFIVPEDELSDEELDEHIRKLEEQAKKRMEVKE